MRHLSVVLFPALNVPLRPTDTKKEIMSLGLDVKVIFRLRARNMDIA